MRGATTATDALLDRRARIVSAALRSAYAWSAHPFEQRAVGEIARMTGVVMFELGPGAGPVTPAQLIRSLQEPLKGLLPPLPEVLDGGEYGVSIDGLSLLTTDAQLSPDAYDIGSEYIREVVGSHDPGREWLPSWAWMRAEDVERELFGKLIASGTPDRYRITRQFIVEHPAGDLREIAEACNQAGAERVARYRPIPTHQTYQCSSGTWWWACALCRWPMNIDGRLVRCGYGFHEATFQLLDNGRGTPKLIAIHQPVVPGIRFKTPQPRRSDNAVAVEEPVWRFVVVPGCTELRIARLAAANGATVELYPRYDRWDISARSGDAYWDLDIKEHNNVETLKAHLRDRPPTARHILLPYTHRAQIHAVAAAASDHIVLNEADFIAAVKRAARRTRKQKEAVQ